MQLFPILHEPALKTLASFQEIEVESATFKNSVLKSSSSQEGLRAKEPSSSVSRAQLLYSGHAVQESVQLRHSAHGASAAQIEELNYSPQAMQPKSQFSLGIQPTEPQQLRLKSSTNLLRPCSLRVSLAQTI